ncbi:hypothetical protein [Pseudomonas sp. CF161]|uniref:hypothetical protein n=1 Tax=Pseudomonas sp. CF161 TaxID=911241 RepID=UPI0003550B96|nr:hypothetical protein [Pseudomonas sp. CF161]EPL14783.1 hypothetical protein CF161_06761 [Pseudomonas sp. CF161]
MSATLRTLRFYLAVGLAQGVLLMGIWLSNTVSGEVMVASSAGLLMGGGLLQLLPERRGQGLTWLAAAGLGLVVTGLVLACRELPLTSWVLSSVTAGLVLLTLISAAVLPGLAHFWRRFFGHGLGVALALPLPWLAQALFKTWTSSHYRDPFKGGWEALVFFAGPTLAFSLGLFLIGLCLNMLLRRNTLAATC